ncbi:MAG: XTP/dITP diphosphatase [Candidatus Bathyarchaeia archaeon]
MPRIKTLYFATGNSAKLREVETILHGLPLVIVQVNAKGREIQSDLLEEVAKESAQTAANRLKIPLFVEDSGLFIDALNGFPGPYTSYVFRTIGIQGLLSLMERATCRMAVFRSVVAFCRPGEKPTCFYGEAFGKIASSARGAQGFGFDPIFEPDGGGSLTFAEMTISQKSQLSHRAKAVKAFAKWFLKLNST